MPNYMLLLRTANCFSCAIMDRGKWVRDELTRYHLEAEIAACHASAPSWEDTDWRRIVELYDRLVALTRSPIVTLNRAIAYSRVAGPRAAIEAVDAIASHPALSAYHLLPAVLAELWREAGDAERAAASFRAALQLAWAAPERRFLAMQLDGL